MCILYPLYNNTTNISGRPIARKWSSAKKRHGRSDFGLVDGVIYLKLPSLYRQIISDPIQGPSDILSDVFLEVILSPAVYIFLPERKSFIQKIKDHTLFMKK